MDPTRPFRMPYAPWHGGAPRQAVPAVPPVAPAAPVPANLDTAAAVEEAKRLLDAGWLTQASGVLGNALSAAAQAHGWHAPVVHMLRKHYAATLLEDGQFHAALPQLRLLGEQRAAEAGPADPQALRFRVEAAQCLEHLGDQVSALAEYQSLLPLLERQRGEDPALALEVRRRTAHLLMATGDHAGGRAALHRLLLETERRYGPHHPLAAETRRALG
jgi:hypothetical protein